MRRPRMVSSRVKKQLLLIYLNVKKMKHMIGTKMPTDTNEIIRLTGGKSCVKCLESKNTKIYFATKLSNFDIFRNNLCIGTFVR